jgi:hypothetical protein
VLGLRSSNGRSYAESGVRAAVGLYEGRPVFMGHSKRFDEERPPEDKIGWLENVRFERGALHADMHVLTSREMGRAVMEAADRRPDLWGLSHEARGQEEKGKDGPVISRIESVRGVALVNDPATNKSLFEGTAMRRKVREAAVDDQGMPLPDDTAMAGAAKHGRELATEVLGMITAAQQSVDDKIHSSAYVRWLEAGRKWAEQFAGAPADDAADDDTDDTATESRRRTAPKSPAEMAARFHSQEVFERQLTGKSDPAEQARFEERCFGVAPSSPADMAARFLGS